MISIWGGHYWPVPEDGERGEVSSCGKHTSRVGKWKKRKYVQGNGVRQRMNVHAVLLASELA